MKLSEKIAALRKQNGMTQEELAAKCNVSRQSISKWEADIALPETEKLLLLGELFQTSVDVLLRDELVLGEIQQAHSCCDSAIQGKRQEIYEGMLIKESVTDDTILDLLHVHKVELWNTGGRPKYWTVLYFTSNHQDFPERVSRVMKAEPSEGGNWYVDFKAGNVKYIVFRDEILRYQIGSRAEKEKVCARCRELGISDEAMDWSE